MGINVESAWDVNEIIIAIDKPNKVLLLEDPKNKERFVHGMCGKAQVPLSLKEAKGLVFKLIAAIQNYEDIDTMALLDLSTPKIEDTNNS